jgi:ATP phosphoribosyltransferase
LCPCSWRAGTKSKRTPHQFNSKDEIPAAHQSLYVQLDGAWTLDAGGPLSFSSTFPRNFCFLPPPYLPESVHPNLCTNAVSGSRSDYTMNKKQVLRFGLPKGSLQDATVEKMAKAGYNISISSRSYIPYVDDADLEIRLIRAQEISRYVEHGYLDCGITGYDWIQENGSKVHEVGEFQFSKATRQPARWVLAVPENSPVKSVKDLKGKRVATEVVNLTKKYLRKNKVKAEVEFSWGATEVKAHELVDAIVEITETGSSLRANKLRIVDTLLFSTPRLIANHASWKNAWKRKKIETMALLLKGALEAEAKVGLKMNIAKKNLEALLKSLPALRNPTISGLSLEGWVAVETIIDEHVVRELIPALKAAGAEGIIEYPLNKVVY